MNTFEIEISYLKMVFHFIVNEMQVPIIYCLKFTRESDQC